MDSGVMEYDAPIGQYMRCNMDWKQVLVMVNGFQVLKYLQKRNVPAREKRNTSIQAQYSNGQASEACFPI
jgi:hypothetical protein